MAYVSSLVASEPPAVIANDDMRSTETIATAEMMLIFVLMSYYRIEKVHKSLLIHPVPPAGLRFSPIEG
jgi:hypothetical protein